MKFNIQNPAFLQAAGTVGGTLETRFVLVEGQNQIGLSSNGEVIVKSIQGGEVVRETYGELSNTIVTINADASTEVVIYGDVTKIDNIIQYPQNIFASLDVSKNTALTYLACVNCTGLTSLDMSKNTALTYLDCNGCTGLTNLNVSKNTALTDFDCDGCTGLTSLDVSKNTALTYFVCGNCTGLTSINGIAVDSNVSTAIASAITDATSVDGTVTLRQGDEFNQTIIDAAMEKGWDVQYYQ